MSAPASVTGSREAESSEPTERSMSAASSEASSDDSIIDQWKRSIVVSDVPKDILNMLIMNLELKKRGGGRIDTHTYDVENRKVLVTFCDAAGNCKAVSFLISQQNLWSCRLQV